MMLLSFFVSYDVPFFPHQAVLICLVIPVAIYRRPHNINGFFNCK